MTGNVKTAELSRQIFILDIGNGSDGQLPTQTETGRHASSKISFLAKDANWVGRMPIGDTAATAEPKDNTKAKDD